MAKSDGGKKNRKKRRLDPAPPSGILGETCREGGEKKKSRKKGRVFREAKKLHRNMGQDRPGETGSRRGEVFTEQPRGSIKN